jgi:hypothetical protein
MDKPQVQEAESEEPIRNADEKDILNRVFEKKRPPFNQ